MEVWLFSEATADSDGLDAAAVVGDSTVEGEDVAKVLLSLITDGEDSGGDSGEGFGEDSGAGGVGVDIEDRDAECDIDCEGLSFAGGDTLG